MTNYLQHLRLNFNRSCPIKACGKILEPFRIVKQKDAYISGSLHTILLVLWRHKDHRCKGNRNRELIHRFQETLRIQTSLSDYMDTQETTIKFI